MLQILLFTVTLKRAEARAPVRVPSYALLIPAILDAFALEFLASRR
jgi:hypothetical protein